MVKKFLLMKMISIHAPTRGATCNSIRPLCIYEYQSTLPREERLFRGFFYRVIHMISIHAPTRGATVLAVTIGIKVFKFQSTLPREERLMLLCIMFAKSLFQSTLPREERQSWRTHSLKGVNFNPRSHERSDKRAIYQIYQFNISIHAPTRGAT